MTRKNGIVLLTIPPHTSHRLQPLDKAVYGPFKSYYNRAIDCWMWNNPGKTLKFYDVPALVNPSIHRQWHQATLFQVSTQQEYVRLMLFFLIRNSSTVSWLADLCLLLRCCKQLHHKVTQMKGLCCEGLQTVAPQPVQQHNLALTASDVVELVIGDKDEVGAPAAFSGDGSEHTSDPVGMLQSLSCTSTIRDANYIPRFAILPVPKAPPRKTRCNKRRRKTAILTDTPEKNIIQQRHVERQEKANRKSLNKRNRLAL